MMRIPREVGRSLLDTVCTPRDHWLRRYLCMRTDIIIYMQGILCAYTYNMCLLLYTCIYIYMYLRSLYTTYLLPFYIHARDAPTCSAGLAFGQARLIAIVTCTARQALGLGGAVLCSTRLTGRALVLSHTAESPSTALDTLTTP